MANYVIDDMWHPHMHAVFGALVPLYTPWYVCGIQLVLFHQFLRILSIKFVYIDSGAPLLLHRTTEDFTSSGYKNSCMVHRTPYGLSVLDCLTSA